ncbi:MAG: peptidylprolyl isomerase, partial [Bdellovibrionota bacterium]|nr:peptidylprolyl isomerase [Bdellovibrionota bacterium]
EGKRNPLTEAEKRLVLQRMIEEELLFQKAKKLGLIEKDPQIRKTIISSMMDFIKTNPERTVLPTNEVLKSFFEKNKPEFRPISRIKVDHRIHLKSEDKSKSTSYTPKRLLPINSLLPYLGPSLTKVSLKLKIGETAGPIEKGGYVHYIKVLERESDSRQNSFESVKNEVLKLYQRRQREEFVKKRLLEMRKEALIYVDWSLGKKS